MLENRRVSSRTCSAKNVTPSHCANARYYQANICLVYQVLTRFEYRRFLWLILLLLYVQPQIFKERDLSYKPSL